MNSAQYVSNYLEELKKQGLALMVIAWKIALACVGWAYVFGARGQYCTPANRRARDWQSHPTIKSKCQVLRDNDPKPDCSGCKWYPKDLLTRMYDCRGFTYWVLKLVYGWELEGSGCTSQWNTAKNWKAKGEVKDGLPKDTLCCLFYYKKDSKGRRTSTLEHTGFYFNGETVECSNGVQHFTTMNKKWEVWAVPACIESGEIQPVPAPSAPVDDKSSTNTEPTLRKGSKGDWVKKLQSELIALGYSCGSKGADGIYGNDTVGAVKAFQKASGLKVDGIAGPKTWEALNAADPAKLYTVTVTGCTRAVADEIQAKYGGTITEQKG